MGSEEYTTAGFAKFQVDRSGRTERPASPTIRQRRNALGLLQKQLAHEAGVSACAMSNAEHGNGYNYGAEALQKIETALRRLEVPCVAAAIVEEAWL